MDKYTMEKDKDKEEQKIPNDLSETIEKARMMILKTQVIY